MYYILECADSNTVSAAKTIKIPNFNIVRSLFYVGTTLASF